MKKEQIAVDLGFREDQVHVALQALNLEGLVSHPDHRAPHDSTRDPWADANADSAWMGDIYTVYEASLEEHSCE